MSELSREANAIIEAAAAADEPTGADKKRVRAAVYAQLGLPGAGAGGGGEPGGAAGASAGGAAATTAAGSGLLLKIVGGLALLGAISVGSYVALSGDAADSARPAPAELPATAVQMEPPAVTPQVVEPTAVEPEAVEPEVVKPVEPAIGEPEPKPRRSKPRPAPAATLESLRAEKKLIDDARRALAAGDPAAALVLLDRHGREHRSGQLSAERTGTRVLALCDLGRADDARRDAARFLRRWPKHPMAARVQSSCAR